MFKDDPKKFCRNLGTKNIEARELPPLYGRSTALLEVTVGRKSTDNERAEWIGGEER